MSSVKRFTGKVKKKVGAVFLYLMLIPLFISVAVSLFKGAYGVFLIKTLAFGLVATSAVLTSKAIYNEVDYEEATIAKAPLPYKTISAIVLGVAIFILGFFAGHRGLFETLFVSILAGVGLLLYYGFDIREDKIPQDIDMNPDILLNSLNEAKKRLDSIKKHSNEIMDTPLRSAVDRAVERAEDILSAISENPSAIRASRKFLVVYVEGIEEVLDSYTKLDKEIIDDDMRQRLISLLYEADDRFEKELLKLKESDKFELDVQIDALREQIKRV